MRKFEWQVFAMILGAVVLQGSLAPYLRVFGGTFNFLVIVVICLALQRGSERGMYLALATGLLADFALGGPPGMFALPLVIIAVVTAQLGEHLSKDMFLVPLVIGALSVLGFEVLLLLLFRLGYGIFMYGALYDGLIPRMLLNGALMPLALRFTAQWLPHRNLELR